MTRNAILFHLGDNPFTPGGLGVFFGKRNLQSGALFPGRKSAEGKTPGRRLRKAKLSEWGAKCRVSRSCRIWEPTVCPAVHVMSNASSATRWGEVNSSICLSLWSWPSWRHDQSSAGFCWVSMSQWYVFPRDMCYVLCVSRWGNT